MSQLLHEKASNVHEAYQTLQIKSERDTLIVTIQNNLSTNIMVTFNKNESINIDTPKCPSPYEGNIAGSIQNVSLWYSNNQVYALIFMNRQYRIIDLSNNQAINEWVNLNAYSIPILPEKIITKNKITLKIIKSLSMIDYTIEIPENLVRVSSHNSKIRL